MRQIDKKGIDFGESLVYNIKAVKRQSKKVLKKLLTNILIYDIISMLQKCTSWCSSVGRAADL